MKTRAIRLAAVFLSVFVGLSLCYAQDEVENLATNGGFESGLMDPWTTYGSVTTEVVDTLVGAAVPEELIEGNYCLHLDVTALAANNWDIGLKQAGHILEQDKQYTLSAFVKCSSGTMDIRFKPERDASPWEGFPEQIFTMTEEWTEFSVTSPVMSQTVDPAALTFHIGFAEGDFWMDYIRFYEGEYVPPVPQIRLTAKKPIPEDGSDDVPRDVVLNWTPGPLADSHNVYFGTVFDDVNNASPDNPMDVLVSQGQAGASYVTQGLLDFSQTYYWRVDEVNDAEADSPWKGEVWSFTVESFAYPVENILATASSSEEGKGPENTVDGSGLDESGLLHSNISVDNMWLSSPAGEQPTWIHYEFDKAHKLHQMLVWNSNDSLEPIIGFGFKDVIIEYSLDGVEYMTFGTTHEFSRAPGTDGYEYNTTIELDGLTAKYIRLTANSNWGGILNQFGLSEVRFLSIPVSAREPNPESGATDVALDVTLSWRAGRDAVSHNVYLSDDMQTVINGTAPVTTVSDTSYGPPDLHLGTTYYWRVDEVNESQDPDTWQGSIWNFVTQEYLVLDDFEDYNDFEPDTIYLAWIDGYDDLANGSTVGYPDPEFSFDEHFVETEIVHGGEQSMPYFYDNTAVSKSEATMTLNPMNDWAGKGVGVLSLWYIGDVANAAEPMYVTLNKIATAINEDAHATQVTEWTQWNIDLQVFADQGVDTTNVTTITIGFGDGPPGGSGLVFFDDIRLYSFME